MSGAPAPDPALAPFPVPGEVLAYSLDEVEYRRDSIDRVFGSRPSGGGRAP